MAAEDPSLSVPGDRNRRSKKGSGKVSSAIVWLSSVSSRGRDPERIGPPGSRATARGAPVTLADVLQVGSQRCQRSIITLLSLPGVRAPHRWVSYSPVGNLAGSLVEAPAIPPYAGRGRLSRSRGGRDR